jgi:FkbM family methyltransferase
VIAVEPTADNLAVLERNVAANHLGQVTIVRAAAGRAPGDREFYVRGDVSAVNSFYPTSVYAGVTRIVRVPVLPIDDLVDGAVDLVKIDVEGAELEVLAGMSRVLTSPGLRLVVEWHPALQEAAGAAAEALPRELFRLGFALEAVGHTSRDALRADGVAALAAALKRQGRPVELLARR